MASGEMEGKIVLITGATSGIGKATARALAGMGAHVVIVGRDKGKIEATLRDIKQQTGNGQIDGLQADFAALAEVRRLAEDFVQRYDRLHVLINNAGALFGERRESADGFEMTFAVNHLAPFVLTNLLLGTLKRSAPARIVNVSSEGHRVGKLPFDDLQNTRNYSGVKVYGQSKLANILFTYELARKLKGAAVTANTLHPGGVATNFGNGQPGLFNRLLRFAIQFGLTPEQGAQTSIYLASSPDIAEVSGLYFAKKRPRRSSKASYDVAAARTLWQISADLTGVSDENVQAQLRPARPVNR